ncbi:MAG: hypothetical protein A2452_05685 [Candidatus Firestonebacteria bacterium RIFOXYC2_FULL_39_67]|nr:MAG: hypothetical protein A2536_11760 [Candidatus Firestonebacteria bacterium RIFOXYD2_FULL_39_29]OGF56566.1 MAG: hypothetical protein A2452_05685 [Candidatus Firestonebacteria bacterium RIFOXYC2_FULL_39_67]
MEEKMNEQEVFKLMFMQLIYTLQNAAVMQLGKIMNPMTNKIEKNLQQANGTIEMLRMLKAKTVNNLGKEEQEMMDQVILTLQLNYADEVEREKKTGEIKTEEKKTNG